MTVDTGHVFELESIARLPRGSRAILEVPDWLADSLRPHVNEFAGDAETRRLRIPLHPSGTQRLGSVMLHAKSAANCVLLVQIPEADRKEHAYEIAVRHIYRKVEVGRVTWSLGGRRRRNEQRNRDGLGANVSSWRCVPQAAMSASGREQPTPALRLKEK